MINKQTKRANKFSDRLQRNPVVVFILLIASGVLLITSAYAWFSASLNVKINFFNVGVSSNHNIYISLDGINWTDEVDLTVDSVIHDLVGTYPHHTNQWALGGLWPVSSSGIRTPNHDRFDIFIGDVSKRNRREPGVRYLSTKLAAEPRANQNNSYIAFDVFIKNVTGSPNPDNLYFEDQTTIEFDESVDEELTESMSNLLHSMRFGIVKIGSVPHGTDPRAIQDISCDNQCRSIIYEPYHLDHSQKAIELAEEFGVELIDGVYRNTYSMYKAGIARRHINGQEGSGVPLDSEYFKLQDTITNFDYPLYQIPNGITKFRAYVWVEGQDMDSLETRSEGAPVFIYVNFEKDQAGYE